VKPFKRRRRGGITATFEIAEAHLLANLSGQVVELLRDRNGPDESDADPLAAQLGMGGPSLPPEDPVLQRLLPDAYRDDPDDAGEFRRFTERSLTSAKVLNAETLIGSLVDGGLTFGEMPSEDDDPVEVELDDDEVQAWLRALTEEDTELVAQSDDEAVSAMSDIFEWLGFVQETLISALD
jgi:hypothetical protein